jgi:hypothetical protein
MIISERSSVTPEKIVGEMQNFSILRPADRGSAFAALSPALGAMIRNLELDYIVDEIDYEEVTKFTNLAKVYLKALQTYDASTDEWLAVFHQFKSLLENNLRALRKHKAQS